MMIRILTSISDSSPIITLGEANNLLLPEVVKQLNAFPGQEPYVVLVFEAQVLGHHGDRLLASDLYI